MTTKTEPIPKTVFSLKLWRGPFYFHLIDNLKETIRTMYQESHVDFYMTEKGYVDHTWESMMASAMGNGELWIAIQDGKVVGWLIGCYSKEVDNEPTYTIRQAWVDPLLRRTPKVKEMLTQILMNAKSNFSKHVLIVSSRNTKSYLRWLGKGWIPVTTIIKGDL
jgi:hypothetical protein